MRFGVQLGMLPPEEQFALVRRVEELGFDSVWTGDHVSFHAPLYESLTLLASYAPITRRIRLGTAVYLLALRAPAVAAKMAATVDVLSGGAARLRRRRRRREPERVRALRRPAKRARGARQR